VRRHFVILGVLAAACGGNAAPASAPAPSTAVASSSRSPSSADRANVERIERALADDSMEGRGTATPGGDRAARFLAREMQKIGLMPGGDSAYFQFVPMATSGNGRGLMVLKSLAAMDSYPVARRRRPVNVIGFIPGSDPVLRNQVIVVLSHYDHLGIASKPVNGDSIYNGADDDASGTTAVLEVARHLMAHRPKRTVVFANMTGEELGLLGTNYYLAHPRFPLSQVVAGFEIEMIGRPDSLAGGPGKAWLTGYARSSMGDMLKQYGIAIVPDPRPCQLFFRRSDNYGFAERGIVAHTLSTFNLHKDYHQVGDDVSKIDFDHMTRVIASASEAVNHLANGPTPTWHPGMDAKSMPEVAPASCPKRTR
jgi:hypothetical protein